MSSNHACSTPDRNAQGTPAVKPRALRLLMYALTVVSSTLILILLLKFAFDASPLDYVPWSSDELDYWHETLSFKEAGFNTGYYGYEEHPATFGRYGGHGFFFPMLLAGLSQFTGWQYDAAFILNSAFIIFAWAAFLAMIRPGAKEAGLYLAFSLTYTPVFYWQGTLMQEPMQFAVAILMAGFFSMLLDKIKDGKITRRVQYGLISFIFFAGLFRLTWTFLFIPLFFLIRTDRSIIKPLVKAGALIVLEAAIYGAFVAPYPYFLSTWELIRLALSGNATPLLERLGYNSLELFTNDALFYFNLVSYEVLFFFAFVLGWLTRRQALKKDRRLALALTCIAVFQLCIFVFMYSVYVVNGVYLAKHLTPVFIFCFLLIFRYIPVKYGYIFVVINLLIFPAFLAHFRSAEYTNYVISSNLKNNIATFSDKISPYVKYDRNASPWCNTMAMMSFPGVISALPGGVAFNNVYKNETYQSGLKSKFVLINSPDVLSMLSKNNELEFLTKTLYGDLYLNRSSVCFR